MTGPYDFARERDDAENAAASDPAAWLDWIGDVTPDEYIGDRS